MRDWQVGDPIGDGNDIGVPDTKYISYLNKNRDYEDDLSSSDIQLSRRYQKRAGNAYNDGRPYDALEYINKAIDMNSNDDENWNLKGLILGNYSTQVDMNL